MPIAQTLQLVSTVPCAWAFRRAASHNHHATFCLRSLPRRDAVSTRATPAFCGRQSDHRVIDPIGESMCIHRIRRNWWRITHGRSDPPVSIKSSSSAVKWPRHGTDASGHWPVCMSVLAGRPTAPILCFRSPPHAFMYKLSTSHCPLCPQFGWGRD